MADKAIITCALTGVLTDPLLHPVPVAPDQMAAEARRAFEAGAAVMHIHLRRQAPRRGHLPSWDPGLSAEIQAAIRDACPGVILNHTTGVVGPDIAGPVACIRATRPEIAACNAGSLNSLKLKADGTWAWPPMLFDNPVEKIVAMFGAVGMVRGRPLCNLVTGVASGMPADPDLLPVLLRQMPDGAAWAVTAIGRAEVWALHRRAGDGRQPAHGARGRLPPARRDPRRLERRDGGSPGRDRPGRRPRDLQPGRGPGDAGPCAMSEDVARNAARMQALPDRVALLLDPGQPFLELATLAGYGLDGADPGRSLGGGGLIAGIGVVCGIRAMIVANAAGIAAGALQPGGLAKVLRCQEIALENRLPHVQLVESAGANLTDDRVEDFIHGGGLFRNLARLAAAGCPVVTVTHGSSTAGGAYQTGPSDRIVMVLGRTRAFLAGPPLLKAATGEIATEEELGGAEMHATVTGLGDHVAENDREASAIARAILAGLGRILDGSRFLETGAGHGPGTVVGTGRLAGRPLGNVTNNGPLDPAGATKATRFIQACCQAGTPILYLQNTTGFLVGLETERAGMIKHGAKMIQAMAGATVPQITLHCGASFGAGNHAMCGRGFGPPPGRRARPRGHRRPDRPDRGAVRRPDGRAGDLGQAARRRGDRPAPDPSRAGRASGRLRRGGRPHPSPDAVRRGPAMTATPFGTLLIANRGEIARRIIRTARGMGLRTVAVFAAPDAGALHVREADRAVPVSSYLSVEAILHAARETGAQAIHPGYGFLSENAGFAQVVPEAGLVRVGPRPETIALMVEEAPSPALTPALRARMGAACTAAARAIGLEGAGTFEFLLDAQGNWHFLEVNARLQVEHPVTEALTGLDLVEWQIRVAMGEPLPLAQDAIALRGHAIEVRLCAEAGPDHLPQAGRILGRQMPDGLRVDAGVAAGSDIPPDHDSLIAKLVAHGPTRDAALEALRDGLSRATVPGVATNLGALGRILAHPVFAAALTRATDPFAVPPRPPQPTFSAPVRIGIDAVTHEAAVLAGDDGTLTATDAGGSVRLRLNGPGEAILLADPPERVAFLRDGDRLHLLWRGEGVEAPDLSRLPARCAGGPAVDTLVAPMAGRVAALRAAPGERVAVGQALEAMKMEHDLSLPAGGIVAALPVTPGDQVAPGQVLLRLGPA
jgi:geranyl-CoA carboxylase beta subunit